MSTIWSYAATLWMLGPSQPLPDQLDILRGADTTPQIQLLLDSSGSMRSGGALTVCDHYPTAQPSLNGSYQSGGSWYLSRTDQLKAALTGCRSETDGVLDVWASRVLFSVREFGGSRTGLLAPFDPSLGNLSTLESAVMNLRASGGTPMAPAFRNGAAYFSDFFHDGNTERCRQNYLVVMSDGVGNSSGPVDFDFVSSQPDLVVHDANYCFGSSSPGCPPAPYLDEAAGYLLRDSAEQTVDVLSRVTGTQPLRTYTIGFQAPSAADELLRAMAIQGDGQAYTVTTYEQLSAAFAEIISSIVARSRVAFQGGSVQADGLFSGNRLYISVFRPVEDGHWLGNTKKHCVLPEPGLTGCLFEEDPNDSEVLLVNQEPRDLWTGSTAPETNVGGTGEIMLQDIFGVAGVSDSPPPDPLGQRTILTWRPGSYGYTPVHPDHLDPRDTWTGESCAHRALLNALHGFTEQVEDCGAGDMSPPAFDTWPIGDTVHGGTVLLQYTRSCEGPSDRCFVMTVANDGMLHVYDAVDGREMSAIVPGELWRPNVIARHTLSSRDDQPSLSTNRRYYFDGRLSVYHDDLNTDGRIDNDEPAYLIAGLGRGGRGYYLFDVRDFSGVPTATENPPRPLLADEATGFRDLMDTWAAPWLGRMEFDGGEVRVVAVFPSGHVPEMDAPSAAFATAPLRAPSASSDSESQPFTASCVDVSIPQELCATPDPASFCPALGLSGCTPGTCSPCSFADAVDCQNSGLAPAYCYDWPGLSVLSPGGGVWTQYPLDVASGPFRYSSGGREGLAYRVRFSRFDLQPGDYLAFFDATQREIGRLSGSVTGTAAASPWIYDKAFSMRLVTDGVNDRFALGYEISGVDIIRSPPPSPPSDLHHPSLYIVDAARWNGDADLEPPFSGSNPGVFASAPRGSDARQADAIRVRVTRECTGAQGQDEVCIDQHTSPDTADLRWMVCPISAEPSVYTEGGFLRSVYFGDECGQIWVAKMDLSLVWSAKRLLRLNAGGSDGFTFSGGQSKDYRKIFRQLDLVVSTCPGRRATGVYFGTGNIQRPSAEDALQDPAVTALTHSEYSTARDVVGVVWDSTALPDGASLDDLVNVTGIVMIDDLRAPGNQNGWFAELREQERMLRDPLVFDGIAHFDVYRPTQAATECISAVGESRTLIMDNCSAEPLAGVSNPANPDEARTTAVRTDSTIGGGFLLLTPLGRKPIVTLGAEGEGRAALPGRNDRANLRLLMWRLGKI